MALQMSPDNLPGYLPPGTAPFRKCWKETSQVPSWQLCDRGMGAVVMLLCPSPCFSLCPRWGYKKLQRRAGFLNFNLKRLKSQMAIWLWLVLSSEVSPDTKYGGTEHLGKKNLLQSPFQTFCILNEGKAWHGAAESSPVWEQKWELKDCVQTDFHSSWQLKLFNLNNKIETKQQKPSPVSMQEKHPPCRNKAPVHLLALVISHM